MGKASKRKTETVVKAERSDADVRQLASSLKAAPLIVIVLVSFGIYFNALFNGFVYDDNAQVLNNPWIKNIGHIPEIFSKSVWGFWPEALIDNYYRPMMHIGYMISYYIFGLRPWGFHLVNLFFHIGVSLLVFFITTRLYRDWKPSPSVSFFSPPFIAAMLFATHPIHTEAVTWVAGLPDVSLAFFYLLSFYFYLRAEGTLDRNYVLSVTLFFIAILFKEPAVTLLMIVIAYDYIFSKERKRFMSRLKFYIPYIVVVGICLSLRFRALKSVAPVNSSYPELSVYQAVINIFPLFTQYLNKLLLPINLNLWHVFHPIKSIFEVEGLLSLVVTSLFAVSLFVSFRKNKMIFFSLLLVVVPLLPAFYIPAIAAKPFAERYLYLPSFGFVILLTLFLFWLKAKFSGGQTLVATAVLLCTGLYSIGTVQRNAVWKDDLSLFFDTARKSPEIVNVRMNLATAYLNRGMIDEAIKESEAVVKLLPNNPTTHNSLGLSYIKKGRLDEAIGQYQSALKLKADYAEAHNNLGHAYLLKGMFNEAIIESQTAVKLNANFAEAHSNLGYAYLQSGMLNEAVAELTLALKLNPNLEIAHCNLGIAYLTMGNIDKAIEEYQSALKLKPDFPEVHNNLGNAYLKKGQFDRAVEEYKISINLKRDYAEAYNNLGNAYLQRAMIDPSIEEYQIALKLNPNYVQARNNLGVAYARKGLKDQAAAEFKKALTIRPDFIEARRGLESLTK